MSKKIKGKGQEMLYLVAYPFFTEYFSQKRAAQKFCKKQKSAQLYHLMEVYR